MNEKTCKDCLHYEVCDVQSCGLIAADHITCWLFKDKSEWVHLPCKVFDDVYLIYNGAIEKCVVEGIHYTKKSSYVRLRPYHQDYLGNWSKYFTQSISSLGKTIFLTREEAEKALAERNIE